MNDLSGKQILEKIAASRDKFSELGVTRIGLFGSYAAGTQTEQSDIDLLVDFAAGKKNFRNFMGTASFAEKLFGKEVELVTPESLSPHIAPYVEQEVKYVKTT